MNSEQFAYRRAGRQKNDELYQHLSSSHPPPLAPRPPTMPPMHHHNHHNTPPPPPLAPRPTPTTPSPSTINSTQQQQQPVIVSPMPLGPLVVGEKILLPAGIMRIQAAGGGGDGAQPVRMFTASPMVLQSQLPSRNVPICSTSISFDGSTTTISQQQQQRRTMPKVVQAIPFVTSTSAHHQHQHHLTTTTTPSVATIVVANASSATPDSGIQSVPTSPPTPSYIPIAMTTDSSFLEDHDEDYADMPILRPADQDEGEEEIEIVAVGPTTSVPPTPSTPLPPATNTTNTTTPTNTATTTTGREDGAAHGSECETAAVPAISITPTMDSDEIVNRLLALDPEKANAIAMLIKKKTQAPRKRKQQQQQVQQQHQDETEVTSTTATTTTPTPPKAAKRSRTTTTAGRRSAPIPEADEPQVSTSTDPEENPPLPQEATTSRSDTLEDDVNLRYRLAIQKQISAAIQRELDLCVGELEGLQVQQPKARTKAAALRNPWIRKKQQQRRASASSVAAGSIFKRDERKSRFSSRRNTNRTDESPELESMEGRFNGEYEEIPRSIPSCEEVGPLWRAPSLSCGCTRGACTSDVECVNRALRVQCNSECTLTLCANKKFWREDTSRLCVSNGPRSKRFLKTRGSRRAGELLCEYAGEVITTRDAIDRYRVAAHDAAASRILAIGSRLFVDATRKGNVGRFVRHSCKPNSRLEVWSVGGVYRAGIFALFDISSNCEITIDKTGLVPLDTPCNCGVAECKRIVRAAKNCFINSLTVDAAAEPPQHRRFLARNRRKTMAHARNASGLPAILWRTPSAKGDVKFGMRQVFEAIMYRIRQIDGSIDLRLLPYYSRIRKLLLNNNATSKHVAEFRETMRAWLAVIDDDDIDRAYIAITNRWLPPPQPEKGAAASKQRARSTSVSSQPSSSSAAAPAATTPSAAAPPTKRADADLSYLVSKFPIGSYDPDAAWDTYKAKSNDNAVRCVCGALEEDGDMVQCDACHFWLHIDCLTNYDNDDEYTCEFCEDRKNPRVTRPSRDVRLKTQPDVRFAQCTYYKSLVNRRGIQVRLNETVYVNKRVPDGHKALLRNLKEFQGGKRQQQPKSTPNGAFPPAPTRPLATTPTHRKDARIFRVERLFVTPGNNRFVFGSFYAWPHETYVDTTRVFSRAEVFPTPMYDTLPLDEVIGRCMVIDVDTWRLGRPKVPLFKEEDVFLVEFQLGKNQRCFEKVPLRNQYPINTQPYVFETFSKPRKVVRDFKPYDTATTTSTSPPQKPAKMVTTPTTKKQTPTKNLQKLVEKLSKSKHNNKL